MKAIKPLLSIFTILAIVFFPMTQWVPGFGYAIPILLLVWVVLKYSKEKFSDIGFRFKNFSAKAIPIGIFVAVVTFTFMQLAFHPALEYFVSLEYDDSGLNDTIQESFFNYIIMVALAWLIGGFYEEIVFHGFIFTRLEKLIKGKYATHFSFAITAILFGIYHVQLGALGMVNAFVIGAIYQALFLYFKRNLWYAIICHGTYNTAVMTLIYFGYI